MSDMRRMMMMFTRPIDSGGSGGDDPTPPTPVLPYDAEVEYLQSSGTQYIQLPITVSAGTFFSVSGIIIGMYNNNSKYAIFSAQPYAQFEAKFYARNTTNNTITYDSSIGSKGTNGGWTLPIGTETEFELSTLGKTINGTFTSVSRPLTASITNFRLFGGYRAATRYPVKFRSFKIVAGTETLYDLIAVRKDNTGYMYDTISGELFENSGTGNFTYGSDIID